MADYKSSTLGDIFPEEGEEHFEQDLKRGQILPLKHVTPGASLLEHLAVPGLIRNPIAAMARFGRSIVHGPDKYPITERDVTRAAFAAGSVRGRVKSGGSVVSGMFISGRNIPKKRLDYAKKLEKQGKTREQIAIATQKKFGTPLGRMPDGTWRMEISDKFARFQPAVAHSRALEAATNPDISDKDWLDDRYTEALRTAGEGRLSFPFKARKGNIENWDDTLKRISKLRANLRQPGQADHLRKMREHYVKSLKEGHYRVDFPIGDVVKHPGLEHFVPQAFTPFQTTVRHEGFARPRTSKEGLPFTETRFRIGDIGPSEAQFSSHRDYTGTPTHPLKHPSEIKFPSRHFLHGSKIDPMAYPKPASQPKPGGEYFPSQPRPSFSRAEIRRTALHELQHMVQHYGRAEQGASPSSFVTRSDYIKVLKERLKADGFALDKGQRIGLNYGAPYIKGIRKWGTSEGVTDWSNNWDAIAKKDFPYLKMKATQALMEDRWGNFSSGQLSKVLDAKNLDQMNTAINQIEEELFGPESDVNLFSTILSQIGQDVDEGRYLRLSELPPYVAPILHSLNILDKVEASSGAYYERPYDQQLDLYNHTLGEAEARLTELRSGMSEKEMAIRPWWEDWEKVGVKEKNLLTHGLNVFLDRLPLSQGRTKFLLTEDADMTKADWPKYRSGQGDLTYIMDPIAQETRYARETSPLHLMESKTPLGSLPGEGGPSQAVPYTMARHHTYDPETRDYWDTHLEYNALRQNPKTGWSAERAYLLEAAGDVLRELTGPTGFTKTGGRSNEYLGEKLKRLKANAHIIGDDYMSKRGADFGPLEVEEKQLDEIRKSIRRIKPKSEEAELAKSILFHIANSHFDPVLSDPYFLEVKIDKLSEKLGLFPEEENIQKMISEGASELDILNKFLGNRMDIVDKLINILTKKEPDPWDPA